ncbi:sigma-70 family RNA polymerase sigma factor [Streptomyces sp. SYP-A7193]|uniref:sigma-70 family RNA polymerase sigma factor n=1 Tax=Streptomyces sp. SYP-A7193 TaxID=2662065 RepID=UPI001D17CA21|nr:sigma-70 family RNA polymerase sigma factor [Streptomyces sp. SYP-A7193]MCX5040600.1 sigma-70 family RNA polymerase sigma factor [Streptomyces coelicoflavus]
MSTAVLGELLKRLRLVAVGGVVPEAEFTQGVRTLGLSDDEQARLRAELARVGLPVWGLHMHVKVDSSNSEKVVGTREENVTSRVLLARGLLSRYEDGTGYLSARAVEGVVRLAGLDAREAEELRAGVTVQPAADAGTAGNAEASEEPREAAAAPTADTAAVVTANDLTSALAAARAVLESDRFERSPHKRLLSAEDEVGLTALLRGGAGRIAREPGEEELKALPRGDVRVRARDCLVLHNLRLVHSLVRSHLNQGLDYEDLVQHGVLGLMRAARKFDPTMGNKFSTYATWWIRQSITRAIADEGALIRIPVHMHEQMRKVARAERSLAAEGRYASAADVAVRCDMTLQKVEEIRRLTRRTDSLDRVIGDGATLGDFVARTHLTPSVDRQVIGDLLVEAVMDVVDTFTEREARILVRRLGLDGDEPSTLDDLGREFGVTRERIRQIEVKTRPLLRERVRAAGLVGLDALCEEAERAAEKAAEAKRAARYVRATHAARTARARFALRRARAERLVQVRREQERQQEPLADDEPVAKGSSQTSVFDERAEAADMSTTVAEGSGRGETDAEVGEAAETAALMTVAADWERARRMAGVPVDQVSWLADYVRAALGDEGLAALLGQSAADVVVRDAPGNGRLPREVLTALEVLRRVLDALVEAGQRPEDFFDRPAESLRGATPRGYLAARPLVNRESRLAVRDSLRELLAAASSGDRVVEQPEQPGQTRVPAQAQEPEREADRAEPAQAVVETESPAAPQATADWDKALTLTQPPLGGGVSWLAEYALLALGHLQLAVLLGPSVTDAVVRSARQRGTLDRPVVEALEVLKAVLDAVKGAGLRPEHFFERPVAALAGATPRTYLASRPLVRTESRAAVGEALREFVAGRPAASSPAESVSVGQPSVVAESSPVETIATVEADADVKAGAEANAEAAVGADTDAAPEPGSDARAQHESALAALAQDHERRLGEIRGAADERVAAVRAEAERQLDALEEELLHRADRARERHAAHVRRQAEAHVAELEERHREACADLLRRAELAEEVALDTSDGEQRAHELERRLYDYREGAEARIRELESRLRDAERVAAERERAAEVRSAELETRLRAAEDAAEQRERAAKSAREEYRQGAQLCVAEIEARLRDAEAAVAQRDLFVQAARRRAEEAEREATQRIVQSEHNAWLRTTDLQSQLAGLQTQCDDLQAQLGATQQQLGAAQEAASGRVSLRDRWRRT